MSEKFNFNIPDKINVGFQKRSDTYTGKLAFVVYTDKKGVLRKERSWNGWRDQKIEAEEFENEPTEGFVLNKKVGDERWGWNPRKAWVRVYDPRGFEFEISVNNLVFILEECSSIKGKGLEGEFVYAWDRAELLLLPVSSKEYKDSISFKKADQGKVYKKDMKEGCTYLHKDNEEVMYLGRMPCWFYQRYWGGMSSEKRHVFIRLNYSDPEYGEPNPYLFEKGFTKLAAKISDEPSEAFAHEFDKFKNSKWGSGPVELIEKKPLKKEKRYTQLYLKTENGSETTYQSINEYSTYYRGNKARYRIAKKQIKLTPGESLEIPSSNGDFFERETDEIDKTNLVRLFVKTENGTKINLSNIGY